MKVKETIGENIKRIRNLKKLTQEEFAEEIGINASFLSRVEGGKKGVSLENMVHICVKFGCTMNDLLPIEKNEDLNKDKLIAEIVADISQLKMHEAELLRKIVKILK